MPRYYFFVCVCVRVCFKTVSAKILLVCQVFIFKRFLKTSLMILITDYSFTFVFSHCLWSRRICWKQCSLDECKVNLSFLFCDKLLGVLLVNFYIECGFFVTCIFVPLHTVRGFREFLQIIHVFSVYLQWGLSIRLPFFFFLKRHYFVLRNKCSKMSVLLVCDISLFLWSAFQQKVKNSALSSSPFSSVGS